MFEVIREAAAARGKDVLSAIALMAWVGASLATFLLARADWVVIAAPAAGALALVAVPWIRRHPAVLVIAVVGAFGGLLLLEASVRVRSFGFDALVRPGAYGPYPGISEIVRPLDDPALGFGLIPGYIGRYQGHDLRVNTQGFRGDEFRTERTPGVTRILAFGSSITMGAGVDVVDAYPSATASALSARGLQAEAYNFGTPAYTALQIFSLAAQMAPRFRPDVVTVELAPNALHEGGSARQAVIAAARAPAAAISSVERFSFAATALYPPADLRATLERLVARSSSASTDANALPDIERSLAALVALGRTEGFTVYVVIVRPMTDFDRPDADRELRDLVRQRATASGAIAVDTYPLFGPGDPADDFIIFPGDLHPNARAHARIGLAVADTITAGIRR